MIPSTSYAFPRFKGKITKKQLTRVSSKTTSRVTPKTSRALNAVKVPFAPNAAEQFLGKQPLQSGAFHSPVLDGVSHAIATRVLSPTTVQLFDNPQALAETALNCEQLAALVSVDDAGILFGPKQLYTKFARIQAVQAKEGELVETVLADGTKETTNVAHFGDWIVTNPGGEKYIVSGDKFAKKYEPATELGEGWYKPTGGNQQFVQIHQDMQVIASWGETQFIKAGGYLNVTNPADIYGVGAEEFNNTYKLVE